MKLRLMTAAIVLTGMMIGIGPADAHADGPSYAVFIAAQWCDNGGTACFSSDVGRNIAVLVIVGPGRLGVPTSIEGDCEHDTSPSNVQEVLGMGGGSGGAASGMGGYVPQGPSRAVGIAAAQGSASRSEADFFGAGSVSISGLDLVDNNAGVMLQGSFTIRVSDAVDHGDGSPTQGQRISTTCRIPTNAPVTEAYDGSNIPPAL